MNLQPVPIVGGCYADDTRPYSSQDCVNWIPERAEVQGGRSDGILRSAPGLIEFGGNAALINDRTVAFVDANGGFAGIKLGADGFLYVGTGTPGTGIVYTQVLGEDWIVSGDQSVMRCRWTNQSGVLDSGTVGTWLALTSDRAFYVNEQASGVTQTCVGLLEIDAGDGVVLDSATITLSATDL